MNIPVDIHTHRQPAQVGQAVINCFADAFCPQAGQWYSVGIHPWHASAGIDWDGLSAAVRHPQVLAVGEAGLDKLSAVPLPVQQEAFRRQALLSMETGKPLLLHAVKSAGELLEWRRSLRAENTWIVHGFRGKAALAQMYLSHGFSLSFGEHFQPDALRAVPLDRLYLETDESRLPIDEVLGRAAAAIGMSPVALREVVEGNVAHLMREAGLTLT